MTGAEAFDLWWLISIIMIVFCIYYSRRCCFGKRDYREQRRSKDHRGSPDSALWLLNSRYFNCEIDDEELRRRENNLKTFFQTKKERHHDNRKNY